MHGVVTAIAAGVFLGLFQTLHGNAHELPVRTATVLLLGFGVVFVNAAAILTMGPGFYGELNVRALSYFTLAGAIHFSGGWMLVGLSQRRVGVGITGLLVGATPVFTAVIALVVLGEALSIRDLLGISLVVAGVWIASQ
jgi:drug/metabolite transporter (DMT)-like permease